MIYKLPLKRYRKFRDFKELGVCNLGREPEWVKSWKKKIVCVCICVMYMYVGVLCIYIYEFFGKFQRNKSRDTTR